MADYGAHYGDGCSDRHDGGPKCSEREKIQERQRSLWKPFFQVVMPEFTFDYPNVLAVEKWEKNELGEKRLVGTKLYHDD